MKQPIQVWAIDFIKIFPQGSLQNEIYNSTSAVLKVLFLLSMYQFIHFHALYRSKANSCLNVSTSITNAVSRKSIRYFNTLPTYSSDLKGGGWCSTWSLNTLATWCEELTHWKRPWCWERLKAGGEGDNRGWDGWVSSPTWWTWVWASSRSWWWTGRRDVLQSMGLQRVVHDWATELNWFTGMKST